MDYKGIKRLSKFFIFGILLVGLSYCESDDNPDRTINLDLDSDSIIAFTSDRDGNNEIYLMKADGTLQTRITNNPAVDMWPEWSPDGQKITFISDRNGSLDIFIMNSDGTEPVCLTPGSDGFDGYPAW